MKTQPAFTDGVAMHAASPATFAIPSNEQKQSLRIGDDAEVEIQIPGLEPIASGERVWVHVTRTTNGKFCGYVKSFPMFAEDLRLRHRDVLTFEDRHVLDILTLKQQIQKEGEAAARLKPLKELIELADGWEDEIELDDRKFGHLFLASLPEHLIVHLVGDDLPEVELSREGDTVELRIVEYFDPALWKKNYTVQACCDAMIKTINGLIAEGHPLSTPEMRVADLVSVVWTMTFQVTTQPHVILDEIKDCCDRVWTGAEELLA